MDQLAEMRCDVCRTGAPVLTDDELAAARCRLPEWDVVEEAGVRRFRRVFKFKNFLQALAFANRVGEIAEEQGHHPAILVEWGSVTVSWWTHKIGGLHQNDAIMAARTDTLYDKPA